MYHGSPEAPVTAGLLIVAFGRITGAFNRFRTTRALTLSIFKVYDRIWHAVLLQKLKFSGISGQLFVLVSSFVSNRRLPVFDGKGLQEYPINAGFLHCSVLGQVLHLFNYD